MQTNSLNQLSLTGGPVSIGDRCPSRHGIFSPSTGRSKLASLHKPAKISYETLETWPSKMEIRNQIYTPMVSNFELISLARDLEVSALTTLSEFAFDCVW